MFQPTIEDDYEALVMGLVLAVNAPDDTAADNCVRLCQRLAAGLSEHTVQRAKREAETLLQVAGRTR